jgi:Domain of unknown function (DUF5615)
MVREYRRGPVRGEGTVASELRRARDGTGDLGRKSRELPGLRDESSSGCVRAHDRVHLREQEPGRLTAREVFAKASAERRVILTVDLDYGEIVALPLAARERAMVEREACILGVA